MFRKAKLTIKILEAGLVNNKEELLSILEVLFLLLCLVAFLTLSYFILNSSNTSQRVGEYGMSNVKIYEDSVDSIGDTYKLIQLKEAGIQFQLPLETLDRDNNNVVEYVIGEQYLQFPPFNLDCENNNSCSAMMENKTHIITT